MPLKGIEFDAEQPGGGSSETFKISSDDTTANFAESKIVEGTGIIETVLSPAGNEGLEIRQSNSYLAQMGTGLFTGGVLSAGATTGTFDLTSGTGIVVDSTTDFSLVKDNVTEVSFSSGTNVVITDILTQPVTYILIDNAGSIVQNTLFPTSEERRDNIFVGVVVHSDNVNVNAVNNLPDVALEVSSQLHDFMISVGFFSITGNVISPNGANLSMDKSVGTAFKSGSNFQTDMKAPHVITMASLVALTFRYRNQDSSEGGDVVVLDPTTWDDGGVTTTVPTNNNATIQRVCIFPSNLIRVQRGQEVFSNFQAALDAVGKESFINETNISENGLLLASIVTKKSTTDLSNTTDAQIFIASKFGELGSIGSSSIGTLQNAYDNSTDPEIITNATLDGVTIQSGTGVDTDANIEIKNNAGTQTATIDANGNSNFNNVALSAEVMGNQTGAINVDYNLGGIKTLTLTGSVTITILNSPSSYGKIALQITQGGVGSFTITYPASVLWAGGTAPTLSTGVGDIDFITLKTFDGGTTWLGETIGLDYS